MKEKIAKELISVIVPVYNVEAYMEKSLDSIRAQTYANIEVIVIEITFFERDFFPLFSDPENICDRCTAIRECDFRPIFVGHGLRHPDAVEDLFRISSVQCQDSGCTPVIKVGQVIHQAVKIVRFFQI